MAEPKHDANVRQFDVVMMGFSIIWLHTLLCLSTSGMGHVEAPNSASLFCFFFYFPHFKVTDVKSGMPNLVVDPLTSNYSY